MIQTIIFHHTLPHIIMVIIDTISLLYQVFITDYQDNWGLLQDCQVDYAAIKLGITVDERNTHISLSTANQYWVRALRYASLNMCARTRWLQMNGWQC